MELENIQKLIDLAKANDLAELTYRNGADKIVIVINKAPVVMSGPAVQYSSSSSISNHGGPAAANREANKVRDNVHEIKSPLVGTFYSQAAPNEPSFVKVGDKVKKGQVLCILEAMKIMNEIESEIAGEVIEVCVENESLVEFGQTLFRLRT